MKSLSVIALLLASPAAAQVTTTVENGVRVHRMQGVAQLQDLRGLNQPQIAKVEVKRLDKDIYQIVGTKVIIKTRYCYEYAYSEPVILDGDDRKIIFVNSRSSCDVTGVY